MIATLMVWAIDCGDLPLALRIGAYVVRHNLIMPDNFGRTAATVLTEEICNPVLTQAGTDADADLSAFIEPLTPPGDCHRPGYAGRSTRQIMQGVRLCPPWPERCGQHGPVTEAAARSDAPEPERRCETRDCNPFPRPEKADSAAAPDDASAQQAQDESSKSKKTTRKPATRKTTATQKAKRV